MQRQQLPSLARSQQNVDLGACGNPHAGGGLAGFMPGGGCALPGGVSTSALPIPNATQGAFVDFCQWLGFTGLVTTDGTVYQITGTTVTAEGVALLVTEVSNDGTIRIEQEGRNIFSTVLAWNWCDGEDILIVEAKDDASSFTPVVNTPACVFESDACVGCPIAFVCIHDHNGISIKVAATGAEGILVSIDGADAVTVTGARVSFAFFLRTIEAFNQCFDLAVNLPLLTCPPQQQDCLPGAGPGQFVPM